MSTTTAPHPALDPDEAARALFEEARRRRRRRRLWVAGTVALCLLVGAVTYAVVTGAGGGGGVTGGRARSHTGARAGATHGPGESSPAVQVPSFVLQMGVLGRGRIWAANCSGLYVTDGGGTHWATVTPTNLQHTCVATKLSAVAEVGTQDIWVAVDNLPGFLAVPPPDGGGSTRGNGIDYSTDGGTTWRSSVFPGCTSTCGGNISLSFVDAQHGWAEMGTNTLFSTGDGGATWTLVGHPPFSGIGQVDFVTGHVGWGAVAATPGGSGGLFRTTDGGTTWTPVALPPVAGASAPPTDAGIPAFFGPDGVVAAWDGTRVVVYTTTDGGTTWRGEPTSVRTTTATGRPPEFSAAGPADWALADGSTLLVTRDAGTRWTAIVPKPVWVNKPLPSVDFTSASTGWVLAGVRTTGGATCGTSRTGQPRTCTVPALLHTDDGGRTWTAASP